MGDRVLDGICVFRNNKIRLIRRRLFGLNEGICVTVIKVKTKVYKVKNLTKIWNNETLEIQQMVCNIKNTIRYPFL